MSDLHLIKLSKLELDYLKDAKFLRPDLLKYIESNVFQEGELFILNLDLATTEIFRDSFTEELAKVGFDENYEPNEEGKILEALIDRFYVA